MSLPTDGLQGEDKATEIHASGSTSLHKDVYLPEEFASQPERRAVRSTRIRAELGRSKSELASKMVQRTLLRWHGEARCVALDNIFGTSGPSGMG